MFLLGHWLEDSKSWGNITSEITKYELNARTQITVKISISYFSFLISFLKKSHGDLD